MDDTHAETPNAEDESVNESRPDDQTDAADPDDTSSSTEESTDRDTTGSGTDDAANGSGDDAPDEESADAGEAGADPDATDEAGSSDEGAESGEVVDTPAAGSDPDGSEVDADQSAPSLLTGLLSGLITGSGHWVARRHRRALWFFLPAAILVLAGLIFAVVQGRTELAVKTVQLPWLWTFLMVNLALLAFRVWATTDAWRVGRKPDTHRWLGPVGLAVALLLTATPHVFIAARNLTWIDTLETVFDAPPLTATTDPDAYAGPVLSTTTTGPVAPPSSTTTTTEPLESGVPEFVLPPTNLPTTTFLPLEGIADGRYLSVLLAGGDAGPGRGGLRTDTMIVATFDLELNRAYLFGLSRELVHIPIPSTFKKAFYDLEDRLWEQELSDWIRDQDSRCRRAGEWKVDPPSFCPELLEQPEHCDCFPDRLNAIYTYTRNWTTTWPDVPDPGMEALRQSMERLLGIPIDYYALVDMAGFVGLVDALGGVDVWVYESVHEGFSPAVEGGPIVRVDVDPGLHHFDGSQALAYVRDRSVVGDAGRVRRQRCMIRSVAAAADPIDIIWNFPAIAAAIRENTTTNIPIEFLPELVRAAAQLTVDDIVTVSLTGSGYTDDKDWREIPKPDIPDIRWRIQSVLNGTQEGSSEGASNECGDPGDSEAG